MSEDCPQTFFNAEDAAQGWQPAWFVKQMMEVGGRYVLQLSEGTRMVVRRILRVHRAADGGIWLDVELEPTPDFASGRHDQVFYAPSSECRATLNAGHVVAAYALSEPPEASSWDDADIGFSVDYRAG